jgi:hypothetical protein
MKVCGSPSSVRGFGKLSRKDAGKDAGLGVSAPLLAGGVGEEASFGLNRSLGRFAFWWRFLKASDVWRVMCWLRRPGPKSQGIGAAKARTRACPGHFPCDVRRFGYPPCGRVTRIRVKRRRGRPNCDMAVLFFTSTIAVHSNSIVSDRLRA